MCIIHDAELHYVYQNVMDAFEQSKMISALFLRRVGCLICNCKKGRRLCFEWLLGNGRVCC